MVYNFFDVVTTLLGFNPLIPTLYRSPPLISIPTPSLIGRLRPQSRAPLVLPTYPSLRLTYPSQSQPSASHISISSSSHSPTSSSQSLSSTSHPPPSPTQATCHPSSFTSHPSPSAGPSSPPASHPDSSDTYPAEAVHKFLKDFEVISVDLTKALHQLSADQSHITHVQADCMTQVMEISKGAKAAFDACLRSISASQTALASQISASSSTTSAIFKTNWDNLATKMMQIVDMIEAGYKLVLHSQRQANRSVHSSVRATRNLTSKHLAFYRKEHTTTSNRLALIDTSLASMKEEMARLNNDQRTRLIEHNALLKQKNSELSSALADIKEELAEVKQKNSDLSYDLADAKDELAAAKEEIARLKAAGWTSRGHGQSSSRTGR